VGGAAAWVEQCLGGPDGHLGDAADVVAVLDGGGDQLLSRTVDLVRMRTAQR
jgi:hypothetical protein